MTDAAKEARRAYKRKWARENRDKIRAQQERYWSKRAEAAAAQKEPGKKAIDHLSPVCANANETQLNLFKDY